MNKIYIEFFSKVDPLLLFYPNFIPHKLKFATLIYYDFTFCVYEHERMQV